MSGNAPISIHGIRKIFRSGVTRRATVALSGLDLEVREGEVFGFLGPNGAGKTTTIKILLGLIRPTEGRGTVLGEPFGSVEARRRLGFLPDSPNFYSYLTGREFLRFTGRLHRLPARELDRRLEETLLRTGLKREAWDRALRTYSRGMLQRTGIAAAILHRPKLVILDEPMNGLDPLGRREFRDLILSLRNEGVTVFFSSHVLSDVEATCDRVGILHGKRMLECGTLEEILSDGQERVEIFFELEPGDSLSRISGRLTGFREAGRGWFGTVEGLDSATDVVRAILRAGGRILSYAKSRATLEDYFLREISSTIRDAHDRAARAETEQPVRTRTRRDRKETAS